MILRIACTVVSQRDDFVFGKVPAVDVLRIAVAIFVNIIAEVEDRWLHHESDPGEGGPPIPFAVYWVDLKADALPELAAEQGDLLTDLMAKLGI